MSEQTNNTDFTEMDIREIIGRAAKQQQEELAKKTPEDLRREWLENPNNMVNWFPKLRDSGVNVPETLLVEVDYQTINDLVEGKLKTESVIGFIEDMKKALQKIGYPAFIRSSYSSNKHYWNDTCFIEGENTDLGLHLFNIAYYDAFLGRFATVFAVRKLIDIEPSFYAFDGKMPVTKERRYFISDGEVICHHPYWPDESIINPIDVEGNPVIDWQQKLEKLNFESELEIKHLSELSRQVGKHFNGYWSVDWLSAKDGSWYCIDMALGNMSYHWKDCKQNCVK